MLMWDNRRGTEKLYNSFRSVIFFKYFQGGTRSREIGYYMNDGCLNMNVSSFIIFYSHATTKCYTFPEDPSSSFKFIPDVKKIYYTSPIIFPQVRLVFYTNFNTRFL